MAIRFCPSCLQNVVTERLKSDCTHCGTKTKPVDKSLPVPEDRGQHDVYTNRRNKRGDSIWDK